MTLRLSLDAAARDTILAHARETFPEECCGLLVGRREAGLIAVQRALPAANVAARRRDRFEVDPALHLRIQRELRGSGQAVVGHYHSHPGGRAEPSPTDHASIHDPRLAWLIVAVTGRGETEIAAFRPGGGVLRPLPLAMGG